MTSPYLSEKGPSGKNIINNTKFKLRTVEILDSKATTKTSYYTPKNFILKKKKTRNSKKDESLFNTSSESNFFANLKGFPFYLVFIVFFIVFLFFASFSASFFAVFSLLFPLLFPLVFPLFPDFFLKETQISQETSDFDHEKHEKRIKDLYFSEKSLHLQTSRILEILTKEKTLQKKQIENTLQSFIHKNFNEDMPDRLKTFEKFAFSNVERDEHKYIKPILAEIKTFKEPHGTMLITDLWSKNLQKECLEKSNMLKEKKMLEKYLFYKNKSKKGDKREHLGIFKKGNEEILKNEGTGKKELFKSCMVRFNRSREEEKSLLIFLFYRWNIREIIRNLAIQKKLENILDLIGTLNKENKDDKK